MKPLPEKDSQILYSDIMELAHPVSLAHPRMSRENRAAQFSPFAALSGYDDLIRESARYTAERELLDEDKKDDLDRKLSLLLLTKDSPFVTVTWFCPDEKKAGGEVRTFTGRFLGFKEFERLLLFEGSPALSVSDIISMESPFFDSPARPDEKP